MQQSIERTKAYRGLGMEGRIAAWYTKNTAKDMQEFRKLADRFSQELPAQARVLEVAPGPGYFSVELARRSRLQITGLDISRSFVQIASENARRAGVSVAFERGNASAMTFPDNAFDFIFCRAAFKNFTQPIEAMSEMHRVLKPGGRAVIIDLRKDASLSDINDYIKHAHLSWKDRVVYKLTFRYLLIPRAYTKRQFQEMASASRFGEAEINESGMGFEIVLRRNAA
ncbi:MAG: class I SAM-dependent methyltransferase [Steroidobacteraceae bacterium]